MLQSIPHPSTSFVGRRRAAAELRMVLPATRLLTLTGSGGSGKTRLALQIALQVAPDFVDGVCWGDLAALADPGLLPHTIARTLGLDERPGRDPLELLLEYLRGRAALLVLDNCEHLSAACADLLAALFSAGCPLRVLATSREPLGVPGETVWPIPLLTLPEPGATVEENAAAEATLLFVERARAVAPAFTLSEQNHAAVVRICRSLEGLPLAIELAAARVAVLTPQQIAARLDQSLGLLSRSARGSDARHPTLRAALDWSYGLLTPPEQRLFVRLAVFSGGCTLDAVEAVCAGEGLERADALNLLAALHERSLLVAYEHGEVMRYRLLEPIRQYAEERLAAVGSAPWRDRHRDYFLALAEAAEPALDTPEQARWMELLEHDHANLRATLSWCAEQAHIESGLRLCDALKIFWLRRGYTAEGQRVLQRLLAHPDAALHPMALARGLHVGALCSYRLGDHPAAHAALEQSLALARPSDDATLLCQVLIEIGAVAWELGAFDEATAALDEAIMHCRAGVGERLLLRALTRLGLVQMFRGLGTAAQASYEEALSLARQQGNTTVTATILLNLATLASHGGDLALAQRRYTEALELYRALAIRSGIADTLVNLAGLAIERGELATAASACDEAETLYRAAGNLGDLAYVAVNRGDSALAEGRLGEARRQYERALEQFRAAGNRRLVGRCLGQLGRLAVREGDLAEAARLSAAALTVRRAIDHRPGMVFSLDEGMLELALAAGLPVVAARLLGAADAARTRLGVVRKPSETRAAESARRQLLARLGESSFSALWDEGQAMGLPEAADYALASLSLEAVTRPRPELRIIALGPLRVYRGERLLTSADWAYAKARELLLYLLCHQSASREQIGAELWPEASDGQVRQRFSAALAHARGALGREAEWLALAEGRYSVNRGLPFWFDVEAFEAGLAEARRLLAAGGQEERAARLLEEAIGLYQGDFADDLLDGAWLVPRREALRQARLEALLSLARLHGEAGRDEQAVPLYRRVLAQDAYQEEAHHALIRAALRRGRRGEALGQYEALASALAELGATPDPGITALVERARRGEPL